MQSAMINPGATVIGGLNIFKSSELDSHQVSKAYDTVFSSLHTSLRWMEHDVNNLSNDVNVSTMVRLVGNDSKYLTAQIKDGHINLGIYDKDTGKISKNINFNEIGIPPAAAIKAIEQLEDRTRNMCLNITRAMLEPEKDHVLLVTYPKLDKAWDDYEKDLDISLENSDIDDHEDLVANA